VFLKYRFFVLNFKKVSRRHTVDFCSLPESTKKMQNPYYHKKNITNHNNKKTLQKKTHLTCFSPTAQKYLLLNFHLPQTWPFLSSKKK